MADNNQQLPSTTLVVFGITGDLAGRYLLPALAEICASSDISASLKILGVSRQPAEVKAVLGQRAGRLAGQTSLLQMDYSQPADFAALRQTLVDNGCQQAIFYLAVPPEAVLPIVRQLGQAGLNTSAHKLLLEKPFGTNLASARELIDQTNRYFKEEQVYRIDHYLAKEMAQNIAVFLGSNALFRDVWNNKFIEKIEIVAEESIGIENRKSFYEQTGALRDIVQSHLLQLAALTLMEPCPDVLDFSQLRGRRLAALKQLKAKVGTAVRGQYQGYKQEVDNPGSATETFVSLELESQDPNWQNVPLRLISGKRLAQKLTEIRVYFKKSQAAQTNLLKLRIQPKEAIELELWVKQPGYEQSLQKLPLAFAYQQYFEKLPDAYEQVIVDAIRSRTNLFASSAEVLAAWEILQPVLDMWGGPNAPGLLTYAPGSSPEQILKQ